MHAGEGMGGVKGLCSREPHSRGKSALGWLATARAAPLPKLVKFRGTQRTGEAGHCFVLSLKSFLTFLSSEIGFSFFFCHFLFRYGTFFFCFCFWFCGVFCFLATLWFNERVRESGARAGGEGWGTQVRARGGEKEIKKRGQGQEGEGMGASVIL